MNVDARLTLLTRLGFAARGLLYIVIAGLLIGSGRAEDPSGALDYLSQGGGRVLLMVMTAGFLAYGLWRLADAAFDVERHGSDRRGMGERVAAGASGAVHLLLASQAVRLIRGASSAGGSGANEGARTALALPGGEAMLVFAGLVLIGVGVAQLVLAARDRFLRHLQPEIARRPWAKWAGRAGYAARGVVFLISGGFLAKAGLDSRAAEAGGMAEALSWLAPPWNIVVALGLLCFGLFSLIEARFRVLNDVPVEGVLRRAKRAV